MKKVVLVLAIIISILSLNKHEQIVIPKESIRFRVIANSNSSIDQNIKHAVVNNLTSKINFSALTANDIVSTRKNIKESLPQFQTVIEDTLKEENANPKYSINFGQNYFPQKEYNDIYYKEGYYESLVITLGDGKGENFWCVLFPPLCLIEKEQTTTNKVEYKSLIKEIIDKYF